MQKDGKGQTARLWYKTCYIDDKIELLGERAASVKRSILLYCLAIDSTLLTLVILIQSFRTLLLCGCQSVILHKPKGERNQIFGNHFHANWLGLPCHLGHSCCVCGLFNGFQVTRDHCVFVFLVYSLGINYPVSNLYPGTTLAKQLNPALVTPGIPETT